MSAFVTYSENPTLRTFTSFASSDSSGSTQKDCRLVLKDGLACRFVHRVNDAGHSRSLALVQNLHQPDDIVRTDRRGRKESKAHLTWFTKVPLVGIGPLMARYCSPCNNFAYNAITPSVP